MKPYDVVIIGSGLGGLECGYILAKKGLHVCVLEQASHVGGCLQSFQRKGVAFDTGFHYVGGLAEGQPLHTLFRYFHLLDLPWHQLDTQAFDRIVYEGKTYDFATGFDVFAQTLGNAFPHQRSQLEQYTHYLKYIGDHIFDSFQKRSPEELAAQSPFAQSAYEFLTQTITDPALQNIVSGASLKMELNPETLPLYIFAQINSSFIQSAWRLRGSGSLIAESLAQSIRAMGGTVQTGARVTRLAEDPKATDGTLGAALIANGDPVEGRWFISNIHPSATFPLALENKAVRKLFRKRMDTLENTFGMFTVHLALQPNTVPYRNHNLYLYQTPHVWDLYKLPLGPQPGPQGMLVSFQVPRDGGACTRNIDLLTPMPWQAVAAWAGTQVGHRGPAYEELKARWAEACIDLASASIPHLREHIAACYTSTPLSYLDYTGTAQGAAYGIRKDYQRLLSTLLTPRTPIPNLLLTGQNLNLHGVLGVTMTSVYTCAEIVGMTTLSAEIQQD